MKEEKEEPSLSEVIEQYLKDNEIYVAELCQKALESKQGNWFVTEVEEYYGLNLVGKKVVKSFYTRKEAEEFLHLEGTPFMLLSVEDGWKKYCWFAR